MKFDGINPEATEKKILETMDTKGLPTEVVKKIPWKEVSALVAKEGLDFVITWLDNHNLPENLPITSKQLQKILKILYSGLTRDEIKALGLADVSKWKIGSQMPYNDLKQHAGVSAEIIGVTKENVLAACTGSTVKSYRVADLPGKFPEKTPFNKVRLDEDGNVIARIKTMFVGNDGWSNLQKLVTKKWDKIFNDQNLDQIEIPKDFYDELMKNNCIQKEVEKLRKQLEKVKEQKKEDVIPILEKLIKRYLMLDQMLVRSSVSTDEAMYATLYPERYVSKLTAKETINDGNAKGLQNGVAVAGIKSCMDAATSAVNPFVNNTTDITTESEYENLEESIINPEDTTRNPEQISRVPFISKSVGTNITESGHSLINSTKGIGAPAELVSYASTSLDLAMDFANGEIDMKEFRSAILKLAGAVGITRAMKLAIKYATAAEAPQLVIILKLAEYVVDVAALKTAINNNAPSAAELWSKTKQTGKDLFKKLDKIKAKDANTLKGAMINFNTATGIEFEFA